MPEADDNTTDQMPSIPEFFAGRSVFVTGATGFMGKVLVEKLLYSCPDIEHIYCLLRPKKGRDVQERMVELKNNAVFTRLREARPDALLGDQLLAIAGDVSEIGLAMSPQDRALVTQKCSIFFHVAATVRFDDPIRKAVVLNTRGTYEALKLAEEMKKLVAFTYVSTTYCHTNRKVIDEAVYPPKQSWRSMIKMLDHFDDETLETITPKLLGDIPNTYSFSKGLAEAVVNDHRNTVPAFIFRPSIVCSSMSEPMPGWHDNFNGPAGLFIACGKGIIHSVFCDNHLVQDYLPVDMGIKGMIVAAWKNGADRSKAMEGAASFVPPRVIHDVSDDGRFPEHVPVYNCATSSVREVTIGRVANIARELAPTIPLNNCIWYPTGVATTNRFLHLFVVYTMQLFPSIIVDTLLRLRGQKPRLMRLQRRIYYSCRAIEFYLNNFWIFPNNKYRELEGHTLKSDVESFGHNVWTVDEIDYFKICMRGARKYLLNESEDTLPAAKRHIWKMYWIDKAVRAFLLLILVYILMCFFNTGGDAAANIQAVQSE